MTRLLIALSVTTIVSACTWVEMEPQGRAVRVALADEDLSACTRKGELTVSVKDKVGFYERNELKVRDELEVLARNDAPRLGADTLQPAEEPLQGEQRFVAYACGGAAPARSAAAPPATPSRPAAPASGAQTFPIDGG